VYSASIDNDYGDKGMKLFYRIGVVLLAVMLLASCSSSKVTGNGKITTKTRDVPAFSQINVSGAYRLLVMVGAPRSVRVTTDSNILPLVMTTVKDGLLTIANQKGKTFKVSKLVTIRVVVPTLTKITASGMNRIIATRIAGDDFTFLTSGSVQARLTGKATKVSLEVSGAGNIDAHNLTAQDVNVQLTGSGNILVNATKTLDTKITGNGNIKYVGDPDKVDQTIMGSGKIERLK
jgi:hypothetical protein